MDVNELLRRILAPLGFISVVASMAGVSLLLHKDEQIRLRDVVGAILGSIAAGAMVFLLLMESLEGRPSLLLGVSCLAGAGGASTIELLCVLGKKWIKSRSGANTDGGP